MYDLINNIKHFDIRRNVILELIQFSEDVLDNKIGLEIIDDPSKQNAAYSKKSKLIITSSSHNTYIELLLIKINEENSSDENTINLKILLANKIDGDYYELYHLYFEVPKVQANFSLGLSQIIKDIQSAFVSNIKIEAESKLNHWFIKDWTDNFLLNINRLDNLVSLLETKDISKKLRILLRHQRVFTQINYHLQSHLISNPNIEITIPNLQFPMTHFTYNYQQVTDFENLIIYQIDTKNSKISIKFLLSENNVYFNLIAFIHSSEKPILLEHPGFIRYRTLKSGSDSFYSMLVSEDKKRLREVLRRTFRLLSIQAESFGKQIVINHYQELIKNAF